MSATFARRSRCCVCALPSSTCLCALVPRVSNEVEVLLLQHPHEVHEAKGSARLLRLSLARCRVAVGEAFDPAALLDLLDGNVSGSALLYPEVTVRGTPAQPSAARPNRLIVLDGTWRKSLRMLHANPLLQALPRWPLKPTVLPRYGLFRKARLPTQLSTLEATCAALADIEAAPARYEPLLDAFGRFVDDRSARARRAQ